MSYEDDYYWRVNKDSDITKESWSCVLVVCRQYLDYLGLSPNYSASITPSNGNITIKFKNKKKKDDPDILNVAILELQSFMYLNTTGQLNIDNKQLLQF